MGVGVPLQDLTQARVIATDGAPDGQRFTDVEEALASDALKGDPAVAACLESLEIVRTSLPAFDPVAFREGHLTPVFFGSALRNFGVRDLIEALGEWAPPPRAQEADTRKVDATEQKMTSFVFKIQANMDPRHRDCVAFVRIVSGKFERDMDAWHPRLGRKVRLNRPMRLFGQDRESVEVAYPGDIVGLVSHGNFRIGDTLTNVPQLVYNEIPRFPPEVFSYLHNGSPSKYK